MTAATSYQPRVAKIVVGVAGAAGIEFTQEDFVGSAKSYKESKPNEASVTIDNLSVGTIAQLEAPNQTLQIMLGETVPGQIFIGEIVPRGVTTTNDLPNRKTTIKAADGRGAYRDTTASVSYPPNTPVAGIVQDLFALLSVQGVTVGSGSTYPPDALPGGFAHQGQVRYALNELLFPRGYYWTIQGGLVYSLPVGGVAPGNTPIVSPQTGMIGSPTRTDKGCNYQSTIIPEIIAGRGVQITSQFFNGLYRNAVVDTQFSRDGMLWTMACQAEVIK